MDRQDSKAEFVAIDDLRVGMFIYLDLGWMQHPFALNSFKITSPDQIATLVGLGLKRLRWSPEKSDPEPGAASADPAAANPAAAAVQARQAVVEAVAAEAAAVAESRRQRQERLKDQLDSLELCDRQFVQAGRTFRQISDLVHAQPEAAGARAAEAITNMLGKMGGHEEIAIRLLSENMGERASLHSINVTVVSLLLGKAMGLDDAALQVLGTGALLHDIGKIALPERLRWQDEDFKGAERKLYQDHVAHGIALGQAMRLPATALAVIAQHHELADGRGYPYQLAGDKIVLPARIVALVNQYDKLCNPGNALHALTPHEALSHIFAQMKHQYDAAVLASFIRMMGVYPPGSIVELTDGSFAIVVSVNSSRPLKPHIVVHRTRIPRDEAIVEDLEQLPAVGIRRSLKPLQLPKAAFDYLSPRKRICYFFERARSLPAVGEAQ
jgi:putative nucleotidyltransferase with HDIG domain